VIYEYGKDLEAVVRLLRQAAETDNNAMAQTILGVCYNNGLGVSKDPSQAAYWFRLGADNGNVSAECSLGRCYEQGIGVRRDVDEGLRYYRLAAEKNNALAVCALGACCQFGRGVEKDQQEALRLYRLASDILADFYALQRSSCGPDIDADGLPGELGEAARLFIEMITVDTLSRIRCRLAACYQFGTSTAKDIAESIRLYRLAAEHNCASAYYQLGLFYQPGTGVEADMNEAVRLYRLAAMTLVEGLPSAL
jgi:TPR repeat protein